MKAIVFVSTPARQKCSTCSVEFDSSQLCRVMTGLVEIHGSLYARGNLYCPPCAENRYNAHRNKEIEAWTSSKQPSAH